MELPPAVAFLGFSPLGGDVSSEEEDDGTMAGVFGVFLGGIAGAKKASKCFTPGKPAATQSWGPSPTTKRKDCRRLIKLTSLVG